MTDTTRFCLLCCYLFTIQIRELNLILVICITNMSAEKEQQEITSAKIRDLFPCFSGVGPVGSKSGWVLFNNAAAAQRPQLLLDRSDEYISLYNFNPGESSPLSRLTAEKLKSARAFVKLWLNVGDGVVLLGQSATLLLRLLAISYSNVLKTGDEIVVGASNHECNVSPWLDLQKQGVTVRFWGFSEEGYSCVEDLKPLVNDRTKIVTFSHTSNLIGEVNACREITKAVRAINSSVLVIVDGAQYVPHKCPDVRDIDCDFYVFAGYKACAPAFGVLYGREENLASIPGFGNRYQDKSNCYKQFELGAPLQAEGMFSFLGLGDYFNTLLQQPISTVCTRDTIIRAYQVMERFEQILLTKLIEFLQSKPCWRIFGPKSSCLNERVGIVSFHHSTISPLKIEQVCSRHNIYVRQGHLQAYRVCERLGIELGVGVVRVSVMHYNTVEEMDKLIEVLDKIQVSIHS